MKTQKQQFIIIYYIVNYTTVLGAMKKNPIYFVEFMESMDRR